MNMVGILVVVSALNAQILNTQPIQSASPPVPISVDITEQQLQDMQRWMKDYETWDQWFSEWMGRRQPGWFTTVMRKEQPKPPAWLQDQCDSDLLRPQFDRACQLLEQSGESLQESRLRWQSKAHVKSSEPHERGKLWENIHLDVGWIPGRSDTHALAPIGVHYSIMLGRFEVFAAPGIIMLRLPDPDRGSRWVSAYHYGFGYRLWELKLPKVNQPIALHINVAKMWVVSKKTTVPIPEKLFLGGLSITFVRR